MRGSRNIFNLHFAVTAILCIVFNTLIAQNKPVEVNASLDPKKIVIGDWVKMKLEVRHAKDVQIFWPAFEETLKVDSTKSIDIVSSSKTDTALNGVMMTQIQTVTITAFDSGSYMIPPIKFGYKTAGSDTILEATSLPLLLEVQTVAIDTAQSFKPEKDPLDTPFSWREYLWTLIRAGVGILALIILIIYVLTSKKIQAHIRKPKVKLPPHELALIRLREVEEARYWQQGDVKKYYSEISDIVRGYMEERFRILALESTTYELMLKLNNVRMARMERENVRELLDLADMVKFAKAEPLPDEHHKAMTIAIEFIENTKPAPVVEENKGPQA